MSQLIDPDEPDPDALLGLDDSEDTEVDPMFDLEDETDAEQVARDSVPEAVDPNAGALGRTSVVGANKRRVMARKDTGVLVSTKMHERVRLFVDEAKDQEILDATYGPGKLKDVTPSKLDFIKPDSGDPKAKWADFPMQDIYKLLHQVELQQNRVDARAYNKIMWGNELKALQESLEALHPLDDDPGEIEVSPDDKLIHSYRTKRRAKRIAQLDQTMDYSPEVTKLIGDRNIRMTPHKSVDKGFDSWVDSIDDTQLANLGNDDLDAVKQGAKEKEATIQKLIDANQGGQWKLVQRKLGRVWNESDHRTNAAFPVHDPHYTMSDWEEELGEIFERSLQQSDEAKSEVLPYLNPLPEGATEEERTAKLAEEERAARVRSENRRLWREDMSQYSPSNPSGVYGYKFFGLPAQMGDNRGDNTDQDPEHPSDLAPQTAQQLYGDTPRDGHIKGYEEDKDTVQRDGKGGINSSLYEHGDKEEREMLQGADPDLPEDKLPMEVRRPVLTLPEEVKDAMYTLHTDNPLKYHTYKLGAMFDVSPSRVKAILRLRALPNVDERMKRYLRHFGDDNTLVDDESDEHELSDDGQHQDADERWKAWNKGRQMWKEHDAEWHPKFGAGWDPEYYPLLFAHANVTYCDPSDLTKIRQMEKTRLKRFYSLQEHRLDKELEEIKRAGPIGSPKPPPTIPEVLSDVVQPPLRRYNMVLTDISKVKPKRKCTRQSGNTYRIVVRDRDGRLRQPTDDEFLAVRKRERRMDDLFEHEPLQKGMRL